MERKRFWEHSWLGLRALAVIAVMLLTTVTASATDYFVAEYDGSTLTFKKTTTAPDNSSSWDVSDTGTSNPGWYSYCEGIWKVVFDPSFAEAHPKNCSKWFEGCERLFSIEGLKFLNTSEVTNMNGMFNGCSSLTSLDLSSFNTDKVTNMSYMFSGCSGLTSLVLSNFNTGKVTNMSYMFSGCSSLTSLDISTFNTGNVTKMNKMFQACTNLMTIFASNNFTIANVESGSDMFKDCTKLVGGKGTTYNQDKTRYTYARLDDGSGNPGYFANIDEDLINLTLLNGVTTPTPLINNGHSYTTGTKITLSYTAPTGYTFNGFKAMKTSDGTDVTANVISESTLTMPNYPVTVSAKLYVKNVPYMTWDDSKKKLVEATTPDGTPVHVLQGGAATTLGAGWYVAEGDVTYTGQLRFTGDAHLILADGCNMTVGTEANPITGDAINAVNIDLTIYGQSTDEKTMGSLTATGSSNGIYADSNNNKASVTINGGQVKANGGASNGIYACSYNNKASVTINGGQVEATGDYYGIYANSEIGSASITITGGQVTTTGYYGFNASSSKDTEAVILGWTNASDFIKASSYEKSSQKVKIAAGKRFVAEGKAYGNTDNTEYVFNVGSNAILADIAGKTLYPLDGYLLTAPDDVTVSATRTEGGTTETVEPTVYGTGDEATPYYIYKNGDEVTLTFKDYGQDGVEVSGLPIDLAVTDRVPTINFQMQNDDVNITSKYYNTGVDYLDWDGAKKKLVSKNTATDNSDANDKVYFLTGGGATTLPGGWYVVNDWNTTVDNNGNSIDAAYTGQLKFIGDAHLILADGSEMTVINNAAGESAIYGDNASLTICAQSEGEGMGDLLAQNNNSDGIYVNATGSGDAGITINSGTVDGHGNHGFYAKSSDGNATVTVNGGDIIGGNDGFYAESAGTGDATVTFNGGYVHAAGGNNVTIGATSNSGNATVAINGGQINSDVSGQPIVASSTSGAAKIILGWTAPSDYIRALKYIVSDGGTVSVADGQYLADYSFTTVEKVYSGTLDDTELDAIGGQTLYPAMPIAGNDKYISICSTNGDWKLMDGVKAYVVTGYDTTTGTVILSETSLTGLPEGVPVILMKDADGDGSPDGNLDPTFMLVGADIYEAENIENSVPTTISPLFTVGDGTETMAELIFEATGSNDTSDYLVFVLDKDVFKMAAFSDDQVPSADKCFLIVNKIDVLMMVQNGVTPSASAARTIAFALVGSDDTGIERLTLGSSLNGGEWYDLQGRKLNVSPKQKGVYIRNGIKVVVK